MYFTNIRVDWYNSTFILYMCIMYSCYAIPIIVKNKKIRICAKQVFYLNTFLISIILLFFKCFSTTGRDLRTGYYYNFQSATSLENYRDQSIEWGFKVLTTIIRAITDNYSIFLFIVGIFTLCPVLYMVSKYRNYIDVSWYLIYYFAVFYITSFSPIRAALAASIGMIAFEFMIRKKIICSFVFIIVASFFHITALLLLVPFSFTCFKMFSRKMVYFILVTLFFAVYVGRTNIGNFMLNSNRYYNYAPSDVVKIGLEQIVNYLPLFIIFFWGKKYDTNQNIAKISIAYLSTGFCVGMIGYIIPIFGRLQSLFLPLIFVVAYYAKVIKTHTKYKTTIDILFIGYCTLRFWIYISQYYNLEDVMPYTNFLGWTI